MSLPTVFITYAREDAELGAQIVASLQTYGVEVHTDDGIIEPIGDNVDVHLTAQIAACDAYVLVLSPASHTSARVMDATNIAYVLWLQQRIRFFIPVQLSLLGPDDYARLLYRTELDPGGAMFQQRFASLHVEGLASQEIAAAITQALIDDTNDASKQQDSEEQRRVNDTLPIQDTSPPEERERGITIGGNRIPPTRIEPDQIPATPAPASEIAPPADESAGATQVAPPSPVPPPMAQPMAPPSAPPPAPGAPVYGGAGYQQGPPTGAPAPSAKPAPQRGQEKKEAAIGQSDPALLQFSAFHPASLPVGEWQTLLVYAHVAEALAQIQADAGTFTELGSQPATASGTATRQVQQGVELTIEPHVDGVTFSPPTDAFIWRGNWHRSLFRMQGAPSLAGATRPGWIDIYADGLVPIARIDLALPFRAATMHAVSHAPQGMAVTGNVYDRVFISYSHADAEAFAQARELYQQFGITVYCDENLAAGDDYETTLAQMIEAASIFHLLWSPRSAASVECRKEWEHALRREASERFIKPWFWKKPLIQPPPDFAAHHISFRYQHLKRKWWNPQTW